MHSWAFLRTSSFSSSSSPSISRFLSAQRNASRPIFTQSNGSSSSSCGSSNSNGGGGGNKKRGCSNSDLESILRSISSVIFVVVGSSLGLSYWPSLSDSNSFLSFADSRGQNANAEPEHKSNFLFGDAYRRKVFFKYEKRIRTRSPPEKVFEYFASIQTPSGEVLMTTVDLMRAVVHVFPPSESNRIREGYLKGEWIPIELHCAPSIFFMLFDTDNDGLISFAEYVFLVTLLSIPESSFSVAFKMFDLDNNE
ncbi:calcium uptake protein, mitochondrial-like isoform X1 [Camellia sinensis]|uniref:calcium uptake protein, mitochondrial-like isoform X1 n=1 Tax=Camellia sinensis TaxID=4442 RepID=UPI0010369E31|nr:calcium uptake protein, mitochondrial-like isoform X1 [Camellia sinensis]